MEINIMGIIYLNTIVNDIVNLNELLGGMCSFG